MLFRLIFVVLCSPVLSLQEDDTKSWGGNQIRTYYCSTNPNPCMNNGVCVDGKSKPLLGNTYECDCSSSRCSGEHCETCPPPPTIGPQGPCSPNPCKGDCLCQPSCKHSEGYYCRSSSGFLGKDCTIPPPRIVCRSNRIEVTVDKRFVDEFDLGLRNSFLSMQPGASSRAVESSTCKKLMTDVVGSSYVFLLDMPFNQCGTFSVQNMDSSVSFKNQIWFNRDLANKLFDVPIPAIAFECQYTREYKIVTSIQPFVPTPQTIQDEFSVKPTISLCKSETCPSACPANLQVNPGGIYTVGEIIHVTMSLDTGSHVTTVDEMYISCRSDRPTALDSVEIVVQGCGSLAGLPCKVTHNGQSHTVCVSFQTPRSLTCSQIYIHSTLSSCPMSTLQVCPGSAPGSDDRKCSSNRQRRSSQTEEVLGPFYIISGARGLAHLKMYPDGDLLLEMNNTNSEPLIPKIKTMVLDKGDEPPSPVVLQDVDDGATALKILGAISVIIVFMFLIGFLFFRKSNIVLIK